MLRLTAGALLTLQISLIAPASYSSASTGTTHPPLPVMVVDPPTAAGAYPAYPVRRAPGAYDLGPLEAGRHPALALYHRAMALLERTEARKETTRRLPPLRLGHTQATQRLRQAGLGWRSSGGCANRNVRQCTSLQAVRTATVADVITLKRRSGCPIVITGGTEVGHAPGRYSHHAGYKLDIAPNHCINHYIKREYPYQRLRGDGARLYGNSGTVYARESDHWDILFR